MISALPVSGACVPKTVDAHGERPRISFSSASFSCPNPWPPEIRAEMRGPQPLPAHLVLQWVDDLPLGVVHRHELLVREQDVEWLDLVAHELVSPVELLLVLGIGLEIPRHAVLPSLAT